MSKPKETLVALLISRGIEKSATEKYLADKSELEAAQLLDLLNSSRQESARNSNDGDEGFLTGLRKIVESVDSDENLVLPEKPRGMDPDEKKKYISEFNQAAKESNETFAEGIRMILKSKSNIRDSKLSTWSYELSDTDFPRALNHRTEADRNQYNDISKSLQKALDKNQKQLKKIMSKHKDSI